MYSSDHEPHAVADPAGDDLESRNRDEALHVAFLRDADLLIHDAQYVAEEYPDKVGWGHSTVEYAIDVARAAAVRRLALFHHDPTRHDDAIDALGACASKLGSSLGLEVIAAREGLTVEL